jgi:internalin A
MRYKNLNYLPMKNFIIIISLLCLAFNSNSQNIYTIAGIGTSGFSGDNGPALFAELAVPGSVALDAIGNIYICDTYYGRIRKIDATTGIITTIAGNGTSQADSIPAISAKIQQPTGIDIDAAGNIYITEFLYNQVRKINTSGIITTIAGIHFTSGGFSGDNGPATSAMLDRPYDVAVDTAGNVYIADGGNNRIRMVNTSGIITTVAGSNSGVLGDGGPATLAQLIRPEGVTVSHGNIYISDYYHYTIRKVNNAGIITTIAGNGIQGNSGDGGLATSAAIGGPRGIKVDANGNVFFADYYYSTIRKINPSGIIDLVAGTGINGYSGDGGSAVLAQVAAVDVTVDAFGNLYIADGNNNRIRKVCNGTCALNVNELNTIYQISIYPNPTTENLFISDENNAFQNSTIQIKNYLGQVVFTTPFTSQINLQNLSAGMYFLTIQDKSSSKTVKIIKQ